MKVRWKKTLSTICKIAVWRQMTWITYYPYDSRMKVRWKKTLSTICKIAVWRQMTWITYYPYDNRMKVRWKKTLSTSCKAVWRQMTWITYYPYDSRMKAKDMYETTFDPTYWGWHLWENKMWFQTVHWWELTVWNINSSCLLLRAGSLNQDKM
jgi:hypothetical protein